MNTLIQLQVTARITAAQLGSLTLKQLNALRRTWKGDDLDTTTKAVFDSINQGGFLTSADTVALTMEINKREAGISVQASPYEEAILPKGGMVSYSPEEVILTSKDGEDTRIPNYPLPALSPIKRRGEDRLVMILFSLFDIKGGKLTEIRDPKIDNEFYGSPATTYDPSGVPLLRNTIHELLKSNGSLDILKDKTKSTFQGLAASDFWYSFVRDLSDTDYLSLHALVISKLVKQVVVKADSATGLQRPFSVVSATPDGVSTGAKVPAKTFVRVALRGSDEFKRQTKYDSIVIANPINPIAVMPKTIRSPIDLLSLHKKVMTLRGGNKRGAGMIASFMDYCPRQSEIVRRANWFIMAIKNLVWGGHACEVHLKAGDLSIMNDWLGREQQLPGMEKLKEVRFVVSYDCTKGQDRRSHYIAEPTYTIPQVMIADYLTIPDVVAGEKKRDANNADIGEKAVKSCDWLKSQKHYVIMMPTYSPLQFDGHEVFMHGRGHDLMATHSNVLKNLVDPQKEAWKSAVTYDVYAEAARTANRTVALWMFAGEPIYNSLGTWYKAKGSNVVIDEGGEWHFSNPLPEIGAPVGGVSFSDDEIPVEGSQKVEISRGLPRTTDYVPDMSKANSSASSGGFVNPVPPKVDVPVPAVQKFEQEEIEDDDENVEAT